MIKKKTILLLLLLPMLSSCGTYSGKFTCGDAKGRNCMMLSQIDEQVSSGEIEEVYDQKRCFAGRCSSSSGVLSKADRPPLKLKETMEVKLIEEGLYDK